MYFCFRNDIFLTELLCRFEFNMENPSAEANIKLARDLEVAKTKVNDSESEMNDLFL